MIVAMMSGQVKARILRAMFAAIVSGFVFETAAFAQDAAPNAQEILAHYRDMQSAQHRTLAGELRNGGKVSPFHLVLNGTTVMYQFTNPPPVTLVLHLGADGAKLDQVTREGTQQVTGSSFAVPVLGTDITYEDVAMRFLYWPDAKVLGEDTKIARKCWKLELRPPAGLKTAYASVVVWIDQASSAMMSAQAFDANGKLATEFKLIEPQMLDGVWLPKKVRIQRMKDGEPVDSSPTYLIIDRVLKD